MDDINLKTRELVVRNGKGEKSRAVFLNDKIVNAAKSYLKERGGDGEYLFISRENNKVSR
ncbi:tyrosine-type recombinase/integrase [Natranaerofaba carboxydovora]|uniref:tyrosine-type recombinase/integrase n=1 Tax=Natranaerofaba carboxydovora TaxID=2742683 RepID=UPI001F141EE8|nr:Phage integrase family protein [Natranaerofaba carboxydovora]